VGGVWRNGQFRNGWKSFENAVRSALATMREAPSVRGEYEWDRLLQESLAYLERHRASGYTWDCFETFRSVIVRVTLPADDRGKLPNVQIDGRKLTLAGLPGKLDETVTLPAAVSARRVKADYSDGVLEIRLRKKPALRAIRSVPLRVSAKKSPSAR